MKLILSENDIKQIVKEELNKVIKGLKSTTTEDVADYARYQIQNIIDENNLDIQITDLYVHGSRVFGNPRENSDLDVVLYYKGNIREDSLFNILHDEEYATNLTYNGIYIDINPIRDEETGNLSDYIKRDSNS